MDYKDKYEDLIKRIKKMVNCQPTITKLAIESLFPELEESDERIRNEILSFLKEGKPYHCPNSAKRQEWVACLEKQVELPHLKKSTLPNDNVTGFNSDYFSYNGYHINYKELFNKLPKDNFDVEKQCEQELTVIIPKFKAGQTIKYIGDFTIYPEVFTISKVGETYYVDKNGFTIPIKNQDQWELVEQKLAAWSKEDEPLKELAETYLAVFDKHFPILPTLKGEQLADYKNFLNQCQQILGLKYWGIHPTQARLFEKLSLLWAAWGAEHLKGLGQTDMNTDNEKQEWSEEDKKMIESCIFCFKQDLEKAEARFSRSDLLPDIKEDYEKKINWLKSLRPQSHWKPSDEQIRELGIVATGKGWFNKEILSELLEQLKKLKGE